MEQPIIFQNCPRWRGEDIDCYVEHLLDIFTVEKKRNTDDVFDFGGKAYLQLKLSLGTVRNLVGFFVLIWLYEQKVRYFLFGSFGKSL